MEALTEEEERAKSLKRNAGAICFVFAYAWVLYTVNGATGYAAAAAMKGDFLDEFIPPLDKETERVLTNEGGQNLDQSLQADDITKVLSLAQKFCVTDGGMNDHYLGNYICRLGRIDVRFAETAEKHPTFEPGLDCSRDFLKRAVMGGDDPILVPFGQPPPELADADTDGRFDEAYHLSFQPSLFEFQDAQVVDRELEDQLQQEWEAHNQEAKYSAEGAAWVDSELRNIRHRGRTSYFKPSRDRLCRCMDGCTPDGCQYPGRGPNDCVFASDCDCPNCGEELRDQLEAAALVAGALQAHGIPVHAGPVPHNASPVDRQSAPERLRSLGARLAGGRLGAPRNDGYVAGPDNGSDSADTAPPAGLERPQTVPQRELDAWFERRVAQRRLDDERSRRTRATRKNKGARARSRSRVGDPGYAIIRRRMEQTVRERLSRQHARDEGEWQGLQALVEEAEVGAGGAGPVGLAALAAAVSRLEGELGQVHGDLQELKEIRRAAPSTTVRHEAGLVQVAQRVAGGDQPRPDSAPLPAVLPLKVRKPYEAGSPQGGGATRKPKVARRASEPVRAPRSDDKRKTSPEETEVSPGASGDASDASERDAAREDADAQARAESADAAGLAREREQRKRTNWDLEYAWDDEAEEQMLERMKVKRILESFPPTCYTVTPESLEAWQHDGRPDASQRPPPLDYKVRGTCRNHHWGLLAACQPERIRVFFTVTYGELHRQELAKEVVHYGRGIEPLDHWDFEPAKFFNFKLAFSAVGAGGARGPGVYDVELQANDGDYPGRKGAHDVLAMVAFLVFYVYAYHQETVGALRLPLTLPRFARRRLECRTLAEATDCFLDTFDWQHERRYTTAVQLLVGLLNAVAILFAFGFCMCHFFAPGTIPRAHVLTPTSTKCDVQTWSLYGYTMNCIGDHTPIAERTTSWLSVPAELFISPLFNTGGIGVHELSLTLVFCQGLSIFSNFGQTAWIGQTFGRAGRQIFNFLLVYFTIVFGFSFLIFIKFGGDCKQFAYFGDTVYSLLLFSFGLPEVTTARTEPRYFASSINLYWYLLMYSIAAITVALNIFTTIILDAYTQTKEDHEWVSAVTANQAFVYRYLGWLFPNVDWTDSIAEHAIAEDQKNDLLDLRRTTYGWKSADDSSEDEKRRPSLSAPALSGQPSDATRPSSRGTRPSGRGTRREPPTRVLAVPDKA